MKGRGDRRRLAGRKPLPALTVPGGARGGERQRRARRAGERLEPARRLAALGDDRVPPEDGLGLVADELHRDAGPFEAAHGRAAEGATGRPQRSTAPRTDLVRTTTRRAPSTPRGTPWQ